MYSLYDSMRLLKNIYEQLVETSLSETGKPLAYVEDDEVLQSVINHVIESGENKNKDNEDYCSPDEPCEKIRQGE